LEDERQGERMYNIERRASMLSPGGTAETTVEKEAQNELRKASKVVSRFTTQLYTHCYLILFSILGTLARLGLQHLTEYPGAPVIFGVLWANFGGSLVMGFLAEDRMLFLNGWGTPTYGQKIARAEEQESGSGPDLPNIDLDAAKKAHLAIKKTIPLYIGLATGFCGSFTSFSSFIRDIFLAISNDLVSPDRQSPTSRNGGYSFMAMVSVILTTVCLSLSALFIGAHLAIALEPMTLSLPTQFIRKFLDRIAVPLGFGAWATAIVLAAVPPHTHWRGDALFALVFAPVGCLARFYTAIYLNGRIASFPLGTFVANIAGTAILGMCFDISRLPLGGVLGCQVLKGVEDGFCGCLTTVSTWVAELAALRRGHAYVYGTVSVGAGLALLIAIMGGLRWSSGFDKALC
jgi:fluoride ion exporter CrcB/FEX